MEVEPISAHPWHLAELFVYTYNLYAKGSRFEDGFVQATFPPSVFAGPTRRTAGYRLMSESRTVFFDRRRNPDPKDAEDAELM